MCSMRNDRDYSAFTATLMHLLLIIFQQLPLSTNCLNTQTKHRHSANDKRVIFDVWIVFGFCWDLFGTKRFFRRVFYLSSKTKTVRKQRKSKRFVRRGSVVCRFCIVQAPAGVHISGVRDAGRLDGTEPPAPEDAAPSPPRPSRLGTPPRPSAPAARLHAGFVIAGIHADVRQASGPGPEDPRAVSAAAT